MFQHILVPTDGSELSYASARAGIQLAKSLNAKVTGFYAAPRIFPATSSEVSKTIADSYLAAIAALAKEVGITYESVWATSDYPAQAIIKAAENNGCDLIYMASHGRKGLQGLLLGSVTQKVLTHCKIPVLVYR